MEQADLLQPGRVVRMRARLWRVDNVFESEFTATPIDGRDTYPRRFLSEIEELSEGSMAPPTPAITSDPAEQDLLLRAFRLSLVHGSAPLMGLQRSRAIPTEYQLVPLLLAIGQERVRLLIADDVGVGKTIEMGLVVSELIARGQVRRALFVVPANLREQTCEALAHFFHLDTKIVAGHLLRALERQLMPGQSVWRAFPYVVVSVDYAKAHTAEILDAPWDLVVIDEAHLCAQPHVAPGARSGADQQRNLFAQRAAQRVKHLVMLTATPHNGFSDSYASLLDLLDVDGVLRTGRNLEIPYFDRDALASHIVQRRREDLRGWFEKAGEPFPFPSRDHAEEIIDLSDEESALLDRLREYTAELSTRSSSTVNQWVALHLQKRALSSPASLRASIRNRLSALQRKVDVLQVGSPAEAETAVMDFDAGDDLTDETRSSRVDASALGEAAEVAELESIATLGAKVTRARDSKYRRLTTKVIPLAFQRQKAKRVIVFTRYKDTLDYLVEGLTKEAKSKKQSPLLGVSVFAIYGEMNPAERRAEFERFEAAPKAVLVATDCISEGMNLQRACAALVHYELPWNPNRLEQRNGRIDRFRQPERAVTIRTLVYNDPLDVTILEVLVRKAAEIRARYGFAPPFFSSSRELVELMKLYGHAPSQQLELFAAATGEPDLGRATELVGMSEEAAERIKEESFFGHDTVELAEVQRALADTHRAVGSEADVERFLRTAAVRCGATIVDLGHDRLRLELGAAPALRDLAGEEATLELTLDPSVAFDNPAVEMADLAHPLMRRLIDLIRDEGLGEIDASQVGRIAGYAHRGAEIMTGIVHVLARYTAGAEPFVLMEELVPVAWPVWGGDERLAADRVGQLLDPSGRVASSMTGADLREAVEALLGHPGLPAFIRDTLEERRAELVQRGRRLAEVGGDWANALDDVTLASEDLLTVTIVEPA